MNRSMGRGMFFAVLAFVVMVLLMVNNTIANAEEVEPRCLVKGKKVLAEIKAVPDTIKELDRLLSHFSNHYVSCVSEGHDTSIFEDSILLRRNTLPYTAMKQLKNASRKTAEKVLDQLQESISLYGYNMPIKKGLMFVPYKNSLKLSEDFKKVLDKAGEMAIRSTPSPK